MTALDSTGGAAWPFSVGRVICLVSSPSVRIYRLIALLIQGVVVHGRSSLVESFVWLFPFLCAQGKRREKKEEKTRTREKEKEKKKRTREQEKKRRGEKEKTRKRKEKMEIKG